MANEIKLPELGEGVTEGELVKWLVKTGDSVKADQPIAEVLTDKATVEIPTPVSGVIGDLFFKPGQVVKVGSTMASLSSSSAAVKAAPEKSTPVPVAPSVSAGQKKVDVKLPELGEGVSEGELVKWLVKPGDSVKADQPVAEVLTDKATVEVPTPVSGVVQSLNFKSGEVIKVGSTMLSLNSTGSAASTSAATSTQQSSAMPASQSAALVAASKAPSTSSVGGASTAGMDFYPPAANTNVLATPATRRLAREMNVDINQLSGSGLAGRVTREDVLANTSTSAPTAAKSTSTMSIPKPAYQGPVGALEERVPLVGIRKKIAENMQKAKAIIPHFTIMDEAKMDALIDLRETMKPFAEKNGTKITYLPIVMKALIAAAREYPVLNASIDDAAGEVVYKKYFNIGFAADTPQGLVVPVIKNADQKSILDLAKEIIDLSKRARDGKLKPDEMKGASITITNIGSIGGTYATPVINHPEVAIVGMYKIDEKPVVRNGQLASIKVMNYTVTADHRLIDGAVATRFLRSMLDRIENPGQLLAESI